jgi:hypothetical protein
MSNRWIRIDDHLINLDEIGGISIDDQPGRRLEVLVCYPASTCAVFGGDREECEKVLDSV